MGTADGSGAVNTTDSIAGSRLGRTAPIVAGVLGAGLLNGYALGLGVDGGSRYLWWSLLAAAPVALALAVLAEFRPRSAALGLAGLIAFFVALAAESPRMAGPQPLSVTVAVVLAGGAVLAVARRARPLDVPEGLAVAWAGAAFIFELAIFRL
jgi:hypothetical protein